MNLQLLQKLILLVLTWLKKNKVILLKFSFIFLLSFIFSSGHIENPDTHLRITQARFLIENKSFSLEHGYGDLSHGNIAFNDEGVAYSVYNPGQIIMFVPLTLLASAVKIADIDSYYFITFLASFLGFFIFGIILVFFYKIGILLNFSRKVTYVSVIIFAFTSYCFSHSQDSYEHIYESLFILLSWYYLLKSKDYDGYKYLMLSSVFLGFGLMFRSTSILALPGLLFFIGSWRNRIRYIVPILPFIFILLFYNYVRFDNPFDNGYMRAWDIAFNHNKITSFNFNLLPKHIFGLLFSPGKGLLFFSPSIIIAVIGLRFLFGKEFKLFCAFFTTISLYIVVYGSNFAWHGSAWCWGPRYIVPILPLLYIGLFFFYDNIKKFNFFVLMLLLVSFSVQILSVSVFYKRQLVRILEQSGDVFWSDEYYYTFKFFPLVEQSRSLIEISDHSFSETNLDLFLPSGPWKNEFRPASNSLMLNRSVDLNSFNFWWYRLQYFSFISPQIKLISIISVILSSIFLLIILLINYLD